jgi:hypothetical protein
MTYRTIEEAAQAYGRMHGVFGGRGGWMRQATSTSSVRVTWHGKGVQGWQEYGIMLVSKGLLQPQDRNGIRLDRVETGRGVTTTYHWRAWLPAAKQYVITEDGPAPAAPGERVPAAVVVDTRDGYTFRSGIDGVLFTEEAARSFAGERNAEMKPEHRTYKVFLLVPVSE